MASVFAFISLVIPTVLYFRQRRRWLKYEREASGKSESITSIILLVVALAFTIPACVVDGNLIKTVRKGLPMTMDGIVFHSYSDVVSPNRPSS